MQTIDKYLTDYLQQHLAIFWQSMQVSKIQGESFVDYNDFCKALKVDIIKRVITRFMFKFLNGDYRKRLQKNMIDFLSIENCSEELINRFTNEGNKYYNNSFDLSDINARIEWKRRTSRVLFPAYDFLHRYTSEPYRVAYGEKNKKVFAYNFNINLDVNTDFNEFFTLLRYYNNNIHKTNLDLNFYLWNRRTNILLIQFLMSKLNPSYAEFLDVHSFENRKEKCSYGEEVKQHAKSLFYFVRTIDFGRIRKFPATFQLIAQSLNPEELYTFKLSHWHFLQKTFWKEVNQLTKEFIQQFDHMINSNLDNKRKANAGDILINEKTLRYFKELFELVIHQNDYEGIMVMCEKSCQDWRPIQTGMLNNHLGKFIKSFGVTKAIAIKDNGSSKKNRT
ncbi:hypothetical protein [Niallia circulans]|uniref:hypothetical protein n=1 Tax=Niallia circulans TaxID=1397 RepID=UPI001F30017B|nr:hypothetical protein [Niallia circulans]MCF2647405.1 hypothetical protein [Niallia circulans]